MGARLAITGLIGLGCIAAAAGGGYMALRSNAADLRPAPVSEPAPIAVAAPTPDAAKSPAQEPAVPAPAAVAAPTRAAAPSAARPMPASTPDMRSAPTPAAAPRTAPSTPGQPPAVVTPDPTPAPQNPPPAAVAVPTPAPVLAPPQTPAPAPTYDEVTVAADAVLGLRLDSHVSTETARIEDRVNARLLRDVLVGGRVAIASGSKLEGTVTTVERGGKFKERPRLGITFNALVLADGTRITIQTDTVFRDAEAPSGQATAKVGGSAVVGAILGAMLGGKKGALVGSAAGAAGGAAAVAAGDRAEAVMTSGTQLTVRLAAPVTVLIEREYDREDR